MKLKDLKKRIFTSLILLVIVFLIFNFNEIQLYFLIIFTVLAVLEFLQITKKIFKNNTFSILVNLFFIVYVFIFSSMFFFFSNLHSLKVILFIILIGCIASDIGGFIAGKTLKGPKLTKISPNKTYSGALGSLCFTTVLVTLLFFYFLESFNYRMIIIALMTSIFCQIGDLIFSFLKRKAKIKDTGSFLPGHGGILDRIDGILLGVPLGFLTLILLN